jgi:hypothetical protein
MEYIMPMQRDPARLLNIKNLHAISTHRNDWIKRLGRPPPKKGERERSQRATGRRKICLCMLWQS